MYTVQTNNHNPSIKSLTPVLLYNYDGSFFRSISSKNADRLIKKKRVFIKQNKNGVFAIQYKRGKEQQEKYELKEEIKKADKYNIYKMSEEAILKHLKFLEKSKFAKRLHGTDLEYMLPYLLEDSFYEREHEKTLNILATGTPSNKSKWIFTNIVKAKVESGLALSCPLPTDAVNGVHNKEVFMIQYIKDIFRFHKENRTKDFVDLNYRTMQNLKFFGDKTSKSNFFNKEGKLTETYARELIKLYYGHNSDLSNWINLDYSGIDFISSDNELIEFLYPLHMETVDGFKNFSENMENLVQSIRNSNCVGIGLHQMPPRDEISLKKHFLAKFYNKNAELVDIWYNKAIEFNNSESDEFFDFDTSSSEPEPTLETTQKTALETASKAVSEAVLSGVPNHAESVCQSLPIFYRPEKYPKTTDEYLKVYELLCEDFESKRSILEEAEISEWDGNPLTDPVLILDAFKRQQLFIMKVTNELEAIIDEEEFCG